MGQNQKYTLPYDIPTNEYLTLEGENNKSQLGSIDRRLS